ncbi:MAG: hypothetical protein LBI18_02405, partial [Planctomycetaceae bacterium]|nr:hypothetical protein [Planctomycetaceae bacterium]
REGVLAELTVECDVIHKSPLWHRMTRKTRESVIIADPERFVQDQFIKTPCFYHILHDAAIGGRTDALVLLLQ